MCHNFEREHDRLTLIDGDNYNYAENKHKEREEVPLYVLATNLYEKFVRENSEYEINLPSKVKSKLHFFFHQNFADLDDDDIEYNEYRLFHIFDKAWAEIWHLLTLNSYRRFLNSTHYLSIESQLELALCDEKPSLHRLIVLDSNNDEYIATLIETHDPYKRRKVLSKSRSKGTKLNSLNIEEIHQLKPTSLINIGVAPRPLTN
eukprot:UN03080